jgi:hypothetical protein
MTTAAPISVALQGDFSYTRSVTGTIAQLQLNRGLGTLLGEDGKRYTFRRSDVRDVWFHDLTEGAAVAFEPAKNLGATHVRPVSSSF